jgi:hypothetical protein
MNRRARPRRRQEPETREHSQELTADLERIAARYAEESDHIRNLMTPLYRARAIHDHEHGDTVDDGCHLCSTPAYRRAHGLRPRGSVASGDLDDEGYAKHHA